MIDGGTSPIFNKVIHLPAMKELLDQLAAYDLWANSRYVQRLMQLPDEWLDRDAGGSYPTMRATLLHIRDAENTWWGRMTGQPTTWPASPDRSIASLLPINERFRDMVLALDEDRSRMETTYHDLKGNAHKQAVWQMVLHCLNHSTQHRGQLISQMRFLGVDAIPANDLVVFQRSLTTH